MAVATVLRKPSTHIRLSDREIEQRREMLRAADHENLLEGQTRDPATDHIFEAFIQGEIEVTEIVPRLKEFRSAQRR